MHPMSLCPNVLRRVTQCQHLTQTPKGPMMWPGTKMTNCANQTLILSEYGFRKSGEKTQETAEVVNRAVEALKSSSLEGEGTGLCSAVCFRSWKGRLSPHRDAYLVGCRSAGQALPASRSSSSSSSSSLSFPNPHPIETWDHQFLLQGKI